MQGPILETRMAVEWSVAVRMGPGQNVSGDMHLVKPSANRILVAAIDGIGHGVEAAAAARLAVEILENHVDAPATSLIKRCHESLLKTRGVVLTIAIFDTAESTMTWLGVGNVEGLLFRARPEGTSPSESVLLRSGLVGYQLPELQASVIPVAAGDLLIMATDGIHPAFEDGINPAEPTGHIVSRIMNEHFKGNDDALVLAVRYLGAPHEQELSKA